MFFGLFKPKILDHFGWPDSSEETKLSLQVRGENSVQCGKDGAVERNQGCKRGSQKEGGRTPHQQQTEAGVAETT